MAVGAVASDANAMTNSTLKDEIDDGDDCDRWRTRWSTMMMMLVAVFDEKFDDDVAGGGGGGGGGELIIRRLHLG